MNGEVNGSFEVGVSQVARLEVAGISQSLVAVFCASDIDFLAEVR